MFNFLKKKFIDESLEDQLLDLSKEHPMLSSIAKNGKNCDCIKEDISNLGHDKNNPVPVNGIIGEMKYLNRLLCKCGTGLIYHRLGSFEVENIQENVDVYETVCIKGKHWDVLYLHMYHPRRSSLCPEGYSFNDFHPIFSKHPIGYGTHNLDKDFPFGVDEFIASFIGGTLGEKFAKKLTDIVSNRNNFIRPKEQEEKIKLIFPQNI